MTRKIDRFLKRHRPDTPCLVVDLDLVEANYRALVRAMPLTEVFYAVKANPAPELLRRLADLGAGFDAASEPEVRMALAAGAPPERISFGNTIKKRADIARAYDRGVRLFAFDSAAELDKLAQAAPGSRVFCRLLLETAGAQWALDRKFGCRPDMAADLLARARALGLQPAGVSFHVGSQLTDTAPWDPAVAAAAGVLRALRGRGLQPDLVNLGGGFPTTYREAVAGVDTHAAAISAAMTRHFGNALPRTMVEPGRVLVGDAGVIEAEVVLVARKGYGEARRWVYLDVGRYGGLAETEGEAIRYPIVTARDGGADGPVAIAGPTCDSADVLYDAADYRLPLDLRCGDRVRIHGAGAYTASYASVGFNGFAPMAAYCI